MSEFKEAFSLFVSLSLDPISGKSLEDGDMLLMDGHRTKMAMVCPISPTAPGREEETHQKSLSIMRATGFVDVL